MKFEIIGISTNDIELRLVNDKALLNNSLLDCKTYMRMYMSPEVMLNLKLGDIVDIKDHNETRSNF